MTKNTQMKAKNLQEIHFYKKMSQIILGLILILLISSLTGCSSKKNTSLEDLQDRIEYLERENEDIVNAIGILSNRIQELEDMQ